ncbi:MAG TPA: rhodanese-like domain-containing protein [Bryobacteraceae bacterium]|nr:rhodanese-like domain-containing protein [Bryobacteraceae bacterium]
MSPTKPVQHATPEEIHRRRESGEDLVLIDVREQEEIAIARLGGALICPLSRAAEWIDRLPKDQPLVIFCHHGIRSMRVAMALAERGHENVTNMSGGIDLWSTEVDASVARY